MSQQERPFLRTSRKPSGGAKGSFCCFACCPLPTVPSSLVPSHACYACASISPRILINKLKQTETLCHLNHVICFGSLQEPDLGVLETDDAGAAPQALFYDPLLDGDRQQKLRDKKAAARKPKVGEALGIPQFGIGRGGKEKYLLLTPPTSVRWEGEKRSGNPRQALSWARGDGGGRRGRRGVRQECKVCRQRPATGFKQLLLLWWLWDQLGSGAQGGQEGEVGGREGCVGTWEF